MGFFSWLTSDTKESIPSTYSTRRPITVYMLAPDGRRWKETDYEGYGVFGGKDFHELLAELNGKKTRDEGINLDFHGGDSVIRPRLVRRAKTKYYDVDDSKSCPQQGYFYYDGEMDEEGEGDISFNNQW
jgi:hypothetical protein